MLADLGQVLVGLLFAVAGFVVVVLVCAVLLALFQRVLPGGPAEDAQASPGTEAPDAVEPGAQLH